MASGPDNADYVLSPIARWERKKGKHRPSAFGGVGILPYGSWFLPRGEPRGTDTSPGTAGRLAACALGSVTAASRSSMIESGARRVRWDWRRARCVGRSLPSGESTTACRQHAVGVVAGAPPAALGRAAAPRTAPGGAPLSPPLPSVATALDSRCQVCSRSGAESSRRWVPGTLRTSCELLILVNQPAMPVASSDVADLGCGAEPRAA